MQHLHTDLPPAELFRLAQAMAQVEPVEDHQLRGPGRHRQHRRRAACDPVRRRRPQRFGNEARKDATDRALLTRRGRDGRRNRTSTPT